MGLFKWVFDAVGDFINKNGTLTSPAQKKARKKICLGCDKLVVFRPVPNIKTKGCSGCGCVIDFKTAMKTIERLEKGLIGTPVTPAEALQVKAKIKLKQRTYTELISCPHPDGNKWADIDKQF